jgi:DNA-binding beta-propeller fold protein YncE
VAKWHGRRTAGAPKALVVALSFCRLLGLGCPKQAFAKIATPRAFHHGQKMEKILHPKEWEAFDSFGTYSLDERGNLYLAPMPYISITAHTFERQKNIYKLDSKMGKLSVFMQLEDVIPSPNNPYGIYTLVYDCEDKTLWVAAIDETDYQSQKGVIYHIDPATKTILQRFDALTLNIVRTSKGKYLFAGSAHDNGLYAYQITDGQLSLNPVKLLELSTANDHIRKIKIKANNHLELQARLSKYSYFS